MNTSQPQRKIKEEREKGVFSRVDFDELLGAAKRLCAAGELTGRGHCRRAGLQIVLYELIRESIALYGMLVSRVRKDNTHRNIRDKRRNYKKERKD